MVDVELVSRVVDTRTAVRNTYHKSIEFLEREKEKSQEYINKFRKAKKCIQQITDDRNESVKKYIKDLVTQGLISIRQEHAYNLEINDGDRGSNSKITDILLVSTKTGKPRKVGTAVKQTTSIIFIISLLEMSKCSRMLALDEYLSGASGETAEKLGDVLVALANNNKFQFFIVNHVLEISKNPEIKRIYLKNDNEEEGLVLDVERTKKEELRRQKMLED